MGKCLIIRKGGAVTDCSPYINELAISQGLLAYSNLILSADHANDLDNGKSFGFDNDNTVEYKALKGTYSESVIVNPSASATSLILNTTVGLVAGQEYTLQDGSNKEDVIITSIDSGTVVTVPAITNSYTSAYLYDYYVGNPVGVVDYDFRATITANDTTPMDLITQSFTLLNEGGATLAHFVKFGTGDYMLMTETSTNNFAYENATEESAIRIKTTVVGDTVGGQIEYYDLGDEKNSITGGWIVGYSEANGSQVKNADNLETQGTDAFARRTWVTTNAIDLTNIVTLYIDWELTGVETSVDTGRLEVLTLVGDDVGVAELIRFDSTSGREIDSLDVTSLTGSYFIGTKVRNGTGGGGSINKTYRIYADKSLLPELDIQLELGGVSNV